MATWSSYAARMKSVVNQHGIGELCPVLEYDDESKLFTTEGPYQGFGFVCQPLNGASLSIRDQMKAFLNEAWPADTLIQMTLHASPAIDHLLDGAMRLRGGRMPGKDAEVTDTIATNRLEYLSNARDFGLHDKTACRPRDFNIYVTVKIPIKKQFPTKEELEVVTNLRQAAEKALAEASLAPHPMNGDKWLEVMQVMLTAGPDTLWRSNEIQADAAWPLNGQIVERGHSVRLEHNRVELVGPEPGDCGCIGALGLKRLPDVVGFGQLLRAVSDWEEGAKGMWHPFAIVMNIRVPNQHKEKDNFSRRRSWLSTQAKGKVLQWVPRLRFQYFDFEAVNHELDQEQANIVDCSLQFLVWGTNEKDLNAAMEMYGKFLEGAKLSTYRETDMALPILLTSLPFGLDAMYEKFFERFYKLTSKGATFLMPLYASWKGNTNRPILNYVSRCGQMISIDLFETSGSYNAVIAARSGAGKSVLTNDIVANYLGSGLKDFHLNPIIAAFKGPPPDDGAQVFIVDVGRSYEKLCTQYTDSQFLAFGPAMNFSLDPYGMIDEWASSVDEQGNAVEGQGKMVWNLIKQMAFPSGNITDYQSMELLTILTELWEKSRSDTSIDDVIEACCQHPRQDIQDIGAQLRPFGSKGINGRMFSKNLPPVDFKSRLIVCELEELKTDLHLQQCVLMALINAAQHAMFLSGTARRKLFILDEAWEYLKDTPGRENFFAQFLEAGWRRFRKTNAAGICITQSLLDCYKSAAGEAIASNSPWKLLLEQEAEQIGALEAKGAYEATQTEYKMMRSIRTRRHVYSEIYIRLGEAREVGRLFMDRRTQLLYTTDPNEKALIKKHTQAGLSVEAAIDRIYSDEMATKRMRGAA